MKWLRLVLPVLLMVVSCERREEGARDSAVTVLPRLFVYYPTWAPWSMPPQHLKFPTGIQVFYMHFSAHVSSTSPYFGPVVPGHTDSIDLALMQKAFIDTCHRNGGFALLSITAQGSDGTTLKGVAADGVKRKRLVSSVSSYLKRKGYDGVELDWESDLSAAETALLYKEFHDTLKAWPQPGFVVAATLTDPFIYPGAWNFYDVQAMNQYLDAFFGMNYVMSTAERSWGSLGNANSIWRCMFDCPMQRPTAAPWSGYTGGYWAADFKTNGPAAWLRNGADSSKVGPVLWNGMSTMLNSSSSSRPGSPISYGTPGYITYAQSLSGTSNYDSLTDSRWGISGGLYYSGIDSAGAYNRTAWSIAVLKSRVFGLYDAHAGFIPTGLRYGRQPHFDAMVHAIRNGGSPPVVTLPTGTFTALPVTLPAGGGSVTLSWTSQGATGVVLDGAPVGPQGVITRSVTTTTTFVLLLMNSAGTTPLSATVNVFVPVPPPCNLDSAYRAGLAARPLVHDTVTVTVVAVPSSTLQYVHTSASFPDSAVVLPAGSEIVAVRSYNANTKRVTVSYVHPRYTAPVSALRLQQQSQASIVPGTGPVQQFGEKRRR